MIDLRNEEELERAVQRARERKILIPTFQEQILPDRIPAKVKKRLKKVGLWDVNPLNLFRITWKNEPVASGGGFGKVNYLEFPPALTGVDARIIALVGKWFPTGSHKVGATFGCLVPQAGHGPVRSHLARRRPGRPPGTSAGGAPTTPPFWGANPSPSCPRG